MRDGKRLDALTMASRFPRRLDERRCGGRLLGLTRVAQGEQTRQTSESASWSQRSKPRSRWSSARGPVKRLQQPVGGERDVPIDAFGCAVCVARDHGVEDRPVLVFVRALFPRA